MQQHDLRPNPGAKKDKKRIGRGNGSGTGTYAGKGVKGQKARSGGVRRGFEGGQIPIMKRMPYKRGFKNYFRVEYEIVNLDRIEELFVEGRLEGLVDRVALARVGVVELARLGVERPLKILGEGELTRAIQVRAHKVSAGARAKIEAAGGTVELIDGGSAGAGGDAADAADTDEA